MNIDARKISIVQEFLKLNNEKIIREIESLLQKNKTESFEEDLRPMSLEKFHSEINQSIDDEKEGNITNANDLRKKAEQWS